MISGEQERMIRAINMAIEMEMDGKECYHAAAEASNNEAGRRLLRSLAEEEDIHRKKFEELYDAVRQGRAWPEIHLRGSSSKDIRDNLNKACAVMGVNVDSSSNELDAVQIAIDKEKKSYDFYKNQASNAKYDSEREFYETLAAEERDHELALLDYQEYLSDPAGWSVRTEHPSLDGG